MEHNSCVVCDSSSFVRLPYYYVHEGSSYDIIRCSECGQGVLHPMLGEQEIRRLYTQEYFEEDYRCGTADASYRSNVESLKKEFIPYLSGIRRHVCGGDFLEVGCAGGAVMDLVRSGGFSVTGVELSKDIAEWGRKTFDLSIHVGTLEEQQFAEDSFDVVYLGDVIEHLIRPREMLTEIRRILRPGGIIAIAFPMELSNLGSQLRIARGRPRQSPHKPYHLHYFNMQSMRRFLRECGFEVKETKSSKIIRLSPLSSRLWDYANNFVTRLTGCWADRGFVIAAREDRNRQS